MDTTERGDREWKQAQRQGDVLKFPFSVDTTERGDREWKQAQRQGDFLDNSSTQKTKGGPKLVLSPKGVTALRPLKDRHQFFYIVR